jgi:hypothetical protein
LGSDKLKGNVLRGGVVLNLITAVTHMRYILFIFYYFLRITFLLFKAQLTFSIQGKEKKKAGIIKKIFLFRGLYD